MTGETADLTPLGKFSADTLRIRTVLMIPSNLRGAAPATFDLRHFRAILLELLIYAI